MFDFMTVAVPVKDFAVRFRTARGRGLGFWFCSSSGFLIPRKTRKKITMPVDAVMKILCLIMAI